MDAKVPYKGKNLSISITFAFQTQILSLFNHGQDGVYGCKDTKKAGKLHIVKKIASSDCLNFVRYDDCRNQEAVLWGVTVDAITPLSDV